MRQRVPNLVHAEQCRTYSNGNARNVNPVRSRREQMSKLVDRQGANRIGTELKTYTIARSYHTLLRSFGTLLLGLTRHYYLLAPW
jgi:hypothetical protein